MQILFLYFLGDLWISWFLSLKNWKEQVIAQAGRICAYLAPNSTFSTLRQLAAFSCGNVVGLHTWAISSKDLTALLAFKCPATCRWNNLTRIVLIYSLFIERTEVNDQSMIKLLSLAFDFDFDYLRENINSNQRSGKNWMKKLISMWDKKTIHSETAARPSNRESE